MEVSFGGFIVTKTLDEVLYGYDEPFLEKLRDANPQEGGDPSIDTFVMLSEPNMKSPEEADNQLNT